MDEAPKYTAKQINDIVYWVDMHKDEIEKQQERSKKYGAIERSLFNALLAVQSKLWYIIIIGITATVLGIKL